MQPPKGREYGESEGIGQFFTAIRMIKRLGLARLVDAGFEPLSVIMSQLKHSLSQLFR